jgi:hypothetical protein
MTRPREQLILAVSEKYEVVPGTWLGGLMDKKQNSLLKLPTGTETEIHISGKSFPCILRILEAREPVPEKLGTRTVLPEAETKMDETPPLFIQPSSLENTKTSVTVKIGETIALGGRLTLNGKASSDVIGDAVHLFFGSDQPELGVPARTEIARGIIARWGLTSALTESDLVAASDRLRSALDKRWPGARHRRELPLLHRLSSESGDSFLRGTLDWLVEGEGEVAVIDHKTTDIGPEVVGIRAAEHANQLSAYASAVGVAGMRGRVGTWLHFPMAGVLVEVVVGGI